jgi:parvulin-like peptidyl-prolyl isomerase
MKPLLTRSLLAVALLGPFGPGARADQPASAPVPVTNQKVMVVERVAAVVNDTIIMESEVAQRALPIIAEAEQNDPTLDPKAKLDQYHTTIRQVLDQMVDEQLILEAGADAKLEVTDEEVQKALAEVKRQNHVTDKQLEAALLQQGYSIVEYKKDVRKQILRLRTVNVLVRPRVQISDQDVKAHYDKLSGQSATVTEVHLRHVLVGLPEHPTPTDMDSGHRRANDLLARARAGEDFAALAKANSDDQTTKGGGGDLGWYKRGELPTEWEEVVFAMSPGEVRGPIRGPRGLHLFEVLEQKKETIRPFAEVKDQLHDQMFNEQMDKQTKVWLQELRKKAHVEIKI